MQKLLLCLLVLTASAQASQEVRVAVATNFRATLEQLNPAFESRTSIRIILSSGSTGGLYHQILSGAPYDIFLAADRISVDRLVEKLSSQPATSFCYARGKLALVGGDRSLRQLADPSMSVAIANPVTAPYGKAATEVLASPQFAEGSERHLVRGRNAMQASQYWYTGNVELALVPLSLAGASGTLIPTDWYSAIEQHALLLPASQDRPAAQAYISWLNSPETRAKITAAGYDPCP
jgi:molybdate transport system substrate-binding protein